MRAGIKRGYFCFRPPVVGLVDACKVFFKPTLGPYPPRVALAVGTSPNRSAIGQWRWGFHTVRGGVDPGEHRFRSRVVEVLKDV